MIGLTSSEQSAFLMHATGQQSRAFPTSLKVGLFSSGSGLASGSLINEITTTATRQIATFVSGTNTNTLFFPDLPSSTPTHFAIFDNLNKMIFYGDIENPISISGSGRFYVEPNGINLAFNQISTGAMSAYLRDKAIKHLTGQTIWGMPTSLFVDLQTTFDGLDSGVESRPVKDEYLSKAVTFLSGKNNIDIQFPIAQSEWSGINAVSIRDSANNLLWVKQLQSPVTIPIGSSMLIPINNIQLAIV